MYFPHFFPAGGDPSQLDPKKVQEEFDDFYEEVYEELAKYGEIEELNVCENLGDHMAHDRVRNGSLEFR